MAAFLSLIPSLLSAGGQAAGGSKPMKINQTTNTNVNDTNSQSFGLSNSPTIANIVGPGGNLANALSSPTSSNPVTSPSNSASNTPTSNQTDGTTATGLPTSGVTRTVVPAAGGFGTTAAAYNAQASILNSPMFMLLIAGGVLLFLVERK